MLAFGAVCNKASNFLNIEFKSAQLSQLSCSNVWNAVSR